MQAGCMVRGMAALAPDACLPRRARGPAAGRVQVREGRKSGCGPRAPLPVRSKEHYCRTGLPSPLADSDSAAGGDARLERIAHPVVHTARTAMIAVRPAKPADRHRALVTSSDKTR